MQFSKLLDYIFMTKMTSNAIENIKSIAKNNNEFDRAFYLFITSRQIWENSDINAKS